MKIGYTEIEKYKFYQYKRFYGQLQISRTGGKLAAETWRRTFAVLLWECFDVKNQNGNVLVEAMRSVMQATM